MIDICEAGVENLKNAILNQSVLDYRQAKRGVPAYGTLPGGLSQRSIEAQAEVRRMCCREMVKELEWFYRSAWFRDLFECDGRHLLKMLREESAESNGNDHDGESSVHTVRRAGQGGTEKRTGRGEILVCAVSGLWDDNGEASDSGRRC